MRKLKLCYQNVKNDHKKLLFYTGLKNIELFGYILELMGNYKRAISYISKVDHLLIVLVKLRLGILHKDIAYRFGFSEVVISRVFRSWLPGLAKALDFLIIWPGKEALMENVPKSFRAFKKCTGIIDCTEIFIQKPSGMEQKAVTWSSYKNHNTIKYLICITPSGHVSFVSEGWSCRASDKIITSCSGFLDKIEFGDMIMADRGFTIAEELARRGALLEIPSFTVGRSQLSARDVDTTRKIANVRIHVERVIGRMRKYNLINQTIPIPLVGLIDDMMRTIAALVNLNKSVVGK